MEYNDICPICDFPLYPEPNNKWFHITIDHIIPRSQERGLENNTRLVHKICNEVRGDRPANWKLKDLWQEET